MSSGTDSTDMDERRSNLKRCKLKDMAEVKVLAKENLYEYIEVLHRLVKKQEKKLKKYKKKTSKLVIYTI